ncbi:MAG: DUF3137 domain-containing protein [Armatimonadetes bacterium]|nr:DUF3137 domain-containing protein [Armatimonadota bacterium]
MDFAPFIVLALVIFGVISIVAYLSRQKRLEYMAQLAAKHGFSYRGEVVNKQFDGTWWDFFGGRTQPPSDGAGTVQLFNRGDNRKINFEMRKQTPHGELMIFEYTFEEGSGEDTHYYNYKVAILDTPFYSPPLRVHPAGTFLWLAKKFGKQDIELESAEFNERFLVQSPQEKFAYDFLTPKMMEFFMRWPMWHFEVSLGDFIFYQSGKLDEQFIIWAERYMMDIQAIVPDYLRKDYGR